MNMTRFRVRDRQEAFAHVYTITLTELAANLEDHPKQFKLMEAARGQVIRQQGSTDSPAVASRIDLSAVMPKPFAHGTTR